MKKFLLFLFGVIVGIIGTVVFEIGMYATEAPSTGIEYFEAEGKCITKHPIKVFQGMYPQSNTGLAYTQDYLVVLVANDDNKSYYDDEVVKASENKCFKQVGMFRYTTKEGNNLKTVPVVKLK